MPVRGHSYRFTFLAPVFPAFTLGARSMVGSNDPEERITQPQTVDRLWNHDILVPVFE